MSIFDSPFDKLRDNPDSMCINTAKQIFMIMLPDDQLLAVHDPRIVEGVSDEELNTILIEWLDKLH